MAANPNPARITGPMWRLWEGAQAAIPGVLLSGIYANKSGYHNYRTANQANWPGNYSIRLALDLQGPSDKAAAIDLTMSDAEMRKRTGYLRDAVARNDPRLAAVREFYGTLNSSTVYGRTKSSRTGSWSASSADSTHLWHIHISIFRAYVNIWAELEPILSVLRGESLAQWNARKGGLMLPQLGDRGETVKLWQRVLRAAGHDPGAIDGIYGSKMDGAVDAFRKERGLDGDDEISGWCGFALMMEVFGGRDGEDGKDGKPGVKGDPGPPPTTAQLQQAVNAWVAANEGWLMPSEAEVRAFVEGWLEAHKGELRGPAGKTPTEVTFTGIVTGVA